MNPVKDVTRALMADTSLVSGLAATEVTDPLVLQEIKTLNNRLLLLAAVIDKNTRALVALRNEIIPPPHRTANIE
jgi:hypothetical protein